MSCHPSENLTLKPILTYIFFQDSSALFFLITIIKSDIPKTLIFTLIQYRICFKCNRYIDTVILCIQNSKHFSVPKSNIISCLCRFSCIKISNDAYGCSVCWKSIFPSIFRQKRPVIWIIHSSCIVISTQTKSSPTCSCTIMISFYHSGNQCLTVMLKIGKGKVICIHRTIHIIPC